MSTKMRFFLGVLAVAVPAGTLWAQDQAALGPAGRVVVLDNERLLEGEVERRGETVFVGQSSGEMSLPADRVLKICNSREEAFAFVCSRANMRDADERLRLARWCHLHGLRQQAVQQASAAFQMQPSAEARQLLEAVKRTAADPGPGPAPRPSMAPTETLPAPDVSLEALSAFATKVQPVLMNTCVKCHSAGRGGRFCLTRAYEIGAVNRRATLQNLAAVLGQVNLDRPTLSPLLVKAVSAHGNNAQPPIHGREAPPFRLLRDWIEMTVSTNPHLKEMAHVQEASAGARAPAVAQDRPGQAATAQPPGAGGEGAQPTGPVVVSEPATFESQPLAPAGTASSTRGGRPAPTPPPVTPPVPADEFDPVLFNRAVSPRP
jgi:hypothetical protein